MTNPNMQHIIERLRLILAKTTPGRCPGCSQNQNATAVGNLLFGAGINPEEVIHSKSGERRSDKTNVSFLKEWNNNPGEYFFRGCFQAEEFFSDLEAHLATK